MTLPGRSPLPKELLQLLAQLHQLHHEIHPDRVGRLYGVSGEYVRRQWRMLPLPPSAPKLQDVVAWLDERNAERETPKRARLSPLPRRAAAG